MNLNWPALATLAAVALSWAGIWWLRKRRLNFSLVALIALAVGIPIGLVAGEHVEAINPIGRIYINILLATVAPLILVTIVSSITSLGGLAKLRSIGLRSIFWLLLSNALGVVLALGLALRVPAGQRRRRQARRGLDRHHPGSGAVLRPGGRGLLPDQRRAELQLQRRSSRSS